MTLSIDVKNASGAKVGSVDLPAEIFDAQTNIPLIHQVVTAQLAAARQGTQKSKNRGEVSGGGKKPFKQRELVMPVKDLAVLQTRLVAVLLTQFVHVSISNAHQRR